MNEFISRLTWVDYVAFVAVLWGFYVGYKGGLFPEILRIASYLVTVVVTLRFREPLAQYLTLKTFLNDTTANTLAFFVLLLGVFFLARLISTILLKFLKIGEGKFFYRIIGALLGGCRWLILLSLIFMLIDNSPLVPLQTDIHKRSLVGPELVKVGPALFDFLATLSPQLAVQTKKAS